MTDNAGNLDRSRNFAMQALRQMQALSLPPTPENFRVWYAHAAGTHPQLTADLSRLKGEDALGAVEIASLYEQYFTDERERSSVDTVARHIEETIETVLEHVGSAGQGTSRYGEALSSLSGELQTEPAGHLASLIHGVLEETRQMLTLTRSLEARLASSASEILRLRHDLEEVRIESLTDPLTGLSNRKAFDMALRNRAIEAGESGDPLCLQILDIDFFKKFNDTHGHQTGDQVLKLVAKTIQAVVPEGCLPVRLGGEEFCVLVPRLGLEQAIHIAETVRQAVGSKILRNLKSGEDLGKITLSIGVAEYDLGEPLTTFIERADEALYHAKHSGRNRVCTQQDLT